MKLELEIPTALDGLRSLEKEGVNDMIRSWELKQTDRVSLRCFVIELEESGDTPLQK